MTAIKHTDIKPGDRITYTREGTVVNVSANRIQLRIKRVSDKFPDETLTIEPLWVETTLELIERPLPDEPPIGSIVIFHHTFGTLDAWKRWGDHLGWLHAGNSTPSRRPGDARDRIQGHTWAELLEDHLDIKRTVIQP